MATLFDEPATELQSGAVISPCGEYRYRLWRRWNDLQPVMVWVMLNPSTADASQDDPTIRRCIGFAKREGFGSIDVLNVFALRATNPDALLSHRDPFGPDNEEWLLGCRQRHAMSQLVLGFGAIHSPRLLSHYKRAWCAFVQAKPNCFGITKAGWPRHPLYLPGNAAIQEWSWPS